MFKFNLSSSLRLERTTWPPSCILIRQVRPAKLPGHLRSRSRGGGRGWRVQSLRCARPAGGGFKRPACRGRPGSAHHSRVGQGGAQRAALPACTDACGSGQPRSGGVGAGAAAKVPRGWDLRGVPSEGPLQEQARSCHTLHRPWRRRKPFKTEVAACSGSGARILHACSHALLRPTRLHALAVLTPAHRPAPSTQASHVTRR
mmetsp:Transcript_36277/g.50386  ORF Transcript_36277/g.50386 Transcript_36277/m.50386 type:complete len:202 (+) Transcript_36277:118-723(+)